VKRRPMDLRDEVYRERNMCVTLIARMATALGYHAGLAQHDPKDKNWDPAWKTIVYIDLPSGQVSWHIHESEIGWFADLRPYPGQWDLHTNEQKYARVLAYAPPSTRVVPDMGAAARAELKHESDQIVVALFGRRYVLGAAAQLNLIVTEIGRLKQDSAKLQRLEAELRQREREKREVSGVELVMQRRLERETRARERDRMKLKQLRKRLVAVKRRKAK